MRPAFGNPPGEWTRTEVPALRIIDEPTWSAVQQRLGVIRTSSGADNPDRPKCWEQRRSVHLLSQKLFCGLCGGSITNVGRD